MLGLLGLIESYGTSEVEVGIKFGAAVAVSMVIGGFVGLISERLAERACGKKPEGN